MPHLLIEFARNIIERELLNMPIEVDASGAPADILAPPFTKQGSQNTPFGVIRYFLVGRTVTLQPKIGSAQASLLITFDEASVELLSLGKSVGLLAGSMSASASIAVKQDTDPDEKPIAIVGIDLTQSQVTFRFDQASHARLSAGVGASLATSIEGLFASIFTGIVRKSGFQSTGLIVALTPGVASEDMLTAEALPQVLWVDAQTLAVAVTYAPQAFPAPFQPTPFLPAGSQFAAGIRLSNDGFQRTVRNPAVRGLALQMLTDRRKDDFVHDAYVARGGTGDITDADRAAGDIRFKAYLKTSAGFTEIANETPSPVGSGALRKHISKVPDPLSDFDVEIPELDLWLGQGRVEGRAVARGIVAGIGFRADVRFRATPVLVKQDTLSIELHDVQIDPPDVQIDLPTLATLFLSVLTDIIAGPIAGLVVAFVLSSLISTLVEALIPSDLGKRVPTLSGKSPRSLPPGLDIEKIEVNPEFLAFMGLLFVGIDDPRPFFPRATLVDHIDRKEDGPASGGQAVFICLGSLGTVIGAEPGTGSAPGEPFDYKRQAWKSSVTVTLKTEAIPLPLTRFPWTLQVGYMTRELHAALPDPIMIATPGDHPTTATVWLPEPVFLGHTERRSFTIGIRPLGDDAFVFDIPASAGVVLLEISARVVDALGNSWDDSHQVQVPNETVALGPDFQDFTAKCAKGRREFVVGGVASLLDQLWNPPSEMARQVQDAIRTEQPGVTKGIEQVFLSHGMKGLQVLLAPSLAAKTFTKAKG